MFGQQWLDHLKWSSHFIQLATETINSSGKQLLSLEFRWAGGSFLTHFYTIRLLFTARGVPLLVTHWLQFLDVEHTSKFDFFKSFTLLLWNFLIHSVRGYTYISQPASDILIQIFHLLIPTVLTKSDTDLQRNLFFSPVFAWFNSALKPKQRLCPKSSSSLHRWHSPVCPLQQGKNTATW